MKIPLIFGMFWSAMTLLLDFFVLVPVTRQILAVSYPSTTGTILSSEMVYGEDDDGGTTFGVAVSYRYSVA